MMKLSGLMAARCRRPRFFAIAIALGAAAVQAALQADARSRPSARSRLHGCGE